MPSAVCFPQALTMEPPKSLKTDCFSSCHQRPGEKCGLNYGFQTVEPLGVTMPETMQAVVFHAPWDMKLERLPKPRPAPGEVLVKMKAVGICGSDVHGFTGESGRRAPGMVMGHEAAGEVVARGDGVRSPRLGDPVTIYNIIAHTPPDPDEGDPSFLNKKMIGVNLAKRGAMAEFLSVPAENAVPLPRGISPEIGLLAEPLAVVTRGWRRLEKLGIHPSRLAIVGAGTIGLAAVLMARARDLSHAVVLDTVPEKADRAAEFGAGAVYVTSADPGRVAGDVESRLAGKPEAVIDAVGTRESFSLGLALVEAGGALLLIGNLAREVSLPLQDAVSNEVCLVGTYGFDRSDFAAAVSVLPEIESELSTFIEGRCRLSETPQVMTSLAKGESRALKTVIVFED